MNINTSLGSGSRDREPYSGYEAGGEGEEQETVIETTRIAPPAMSFDRLSSSAPKRRFIAEKASATQSHSLKRWVRLCRLGRVLSWMASGFCAFAFVIVLASPVLLQVLTFGVALSWNEWIEYSAAALSISLTPGLLAAAFALSAIAFSKAGKGMRNKLANEQEQGFELRRLEELMRPGKS